MAPQAPSTGDGSGTASMSATTIADQASSRERLNHLFDLGIWYLLSLWPALHVACANGWGGPDTQDKKDWFAGAVSELFVDRPDTDAEDLEEFLLNIMLDEFETNVDDGTEAEVALGIISLRKRVLEDGDVGAYQEVERRWKNRGMMKADVRLQEVSQDVDGDGEGEEWVDGDGDVEMDSDEVDRAPRPAPARLVREKPEPEVDDEGFTKVASRRKK